MRSVNPAIVGGIGSAIALMCGTVCSFSPPASTSTHAFREELRPSYMFFADSAAVENESLDAQVTPLDGSETSIQNAAKFMVDAFWLQSPQQLVQGAGDSSEVSESQKASLINTQANDLMSKYGERLGKRKLDALILVAVEGGDASGGALSTVENLQGMVTVEVRLLDKQNDILSADASEFKLTQAVASLGPKQRREFKDASVIDIANQLLPPDISAVAVLANLCVSPSARRKGIAVKLCSEAQRMAKEKFGFEEIFLRVETTNEAAKALYEDKLGYECVLEAEAATALRVDGNAGAFVEVESAIVVLKKKI
mmetsp:Transcript_41955/g.89352  ORF Transcript_41955/g.89352 Transcript_41955/m.89352 type:complete len:312 (-) Transcript_41955:231-1166(-)